jgi:hypothetical protein
MRCSPSVICNVIGEMSEALKGRIHELEFRELLLLKIDKLDDRTVGHFLLSYVEENPLRIQIGNRALSISAKAVHQVFGLPASGKSHHNYNVADKRATRADLRKLCDTKGLKFMFIGHGGNYPGLGVSEFPGGLLNIMPMLKNLMWMTGLCSHSSCLCLMHYYFSLTATKWQAWTTLCLHV